MKKTVGLPSGFDRVDGRRRPSTYAVVSAWCSRIPVSAISRWRSVRLDMILRWRCSRSIGARTCTLAHSLIDVNEASTRFERGGRSFCSWKVVSHRAACPRCRCSRRSLPGGYSPCSAAQQEAAGGPTNRTGYRRSATSRRRTRAGHAATGARGGRRLRPTHPRGGIASASCRGSGSPTSMPSGSATVGHASCQFKTSPLVTLKISPAPRRGRRPGERAREGRGPSPPEYAAGHRERQRPSLRAAARRTREDRNEVHRAGERPPVRDLGARIVHDHRAPSASARQAVLLQEVEVVVVVAGHVASPAPRADVQPVCLRALEQRHVLHVLRPRRAPARRVRNMARLRSISGRVAQPAVRSSDSWSAAYTT